MIIILLQGASASTIPVETFSAAKSEYERMKAETPDMTDEALFEAMKAYIAAIPVSAPVPTEGEVAPVPVEGEVAPAPVEGEVAPPVEETPQEVAPPVEE